MSENRMRFAPSPTGYLHVGGLRTALFNYLFAAHTGGKVILRIEDTDQNRKVEGAVENLKQSLEWAGVKFDEGAGIGGDFGPYTQSERLDIYREHAQNLIDQGDAYYCFCTPEELDQIREEQQAAKKQTPYNGKCQNLTPDQIQEKLDQKTPYVIRMKIPQDRPDYIIDDMIRGSVKFNTEQIDDQIILKSDGFPTYHLANVVDDYHMKITHVIRGEEWLPSTPKHVQLYEFFGWEPPKFAHLPLLLNPDRSKLSKRQGDVATEDFRDSGILSEALVNFVALLGWNTADDQEIYSMQELREQFTLERVGKAGAVFDGDKLKWMNQQYIKQLTPEALLEASQPFLPEMVKHVAPETLAKVLGIIKDSLVQLTDIPARLDLFFNDNPELTDEKLKEQVQSEDAQKVLKAFIEAAGDVDEVTSENFGKLMKQVQKETGVKGKGLWGTMRIAITLVEHGPDLGAVVDVFGKEKCLKMIQNMLN